MPDVLAATAARFLDDACEELGLPGGVHEWLCASELDPDPLLGVDCDVLVPAARAGMLDGDTARRAAYAIALERVLGSARARGLLPH